MAIVIFCSFIALFLSVLDSKGVLKNGMKLGFVLVTILGIIHYDYGNDYMSYLNIFNEVKRYSFNLNDHLNRAFIVEGGWSMLCWLFKYLGGFFVMVAVLNIIQNTIAYNFIRKNVNRSYWSLAMFIFLFNYNFYLLEFSMMRQELVAFIFLGMWKYIEERKWWIPLVVLLLCSYIHSSSLILVPFAFWGFIPVDKYKFIGFIYVLLFCLLWLLSNFLNNIFSYALTLNDSIAGYEEYDKYNTKGFTLGLGFIINLIPFVLSILYLFTKKDGLKSKKQLISIFAISFLTAPFSQIITLMDRISIYFIFYGLGALPFIYENIRNKILKNVLIFLFIAITLYNYNGFFQSKVWATKYATFNTIFSQI